MPDLDARERPRPSVPVCHYLLRQYRAAGIEDVRLLRRAEKTDLAAHFGAGSVEGLRVRDTVVAPTAGSVHTLALGCREAPEARIAVGFPDIVLTPATLCRAALDELERGAADICIGSVDIAADERRNWDLLRTDGARVIDYAMKPEEGCALERGTALAVWRPSATAFLLAWLEDGRGAGAVVADPFRYRGGRVVADGVERARTSRPMPVADRRGPRGTARIGRCRRRRGANVRPGPVGAVAARQGAPRRSPRAVGADV